MSNGKINRALTDQRDTLLELWEKMQTVKDTVMDLKEAEAEDRPAKTKKVDEAIADGEKAMSSATKNLVIAYHHGWEVGRGLQGAAYAQSEEEQKKLKAAIKAAELTAKSSKGSGKRESKEAESEGAADKESWGQPAQGTGGPARRVQQAALQQGAAPGVCYAYRGVDHFTRECPGKK